MVCAQQKQSIPMSINEFVVVNISLCFSIYDQIENFNYLNVAFIKLDTRRGGGVAVEYIIVGLFEKSC